MEIRRNAGWIARALGAAIAMAALAGVSHAEAQRRDTTAQAPAAQTAEGVVNIQTASVEELQRLPGIGPSKAAAIVAARQTQPFRRVEDILRVRGIGRATFRRLRPLITVTGPTTLTQEVHLPRTTSGPDPDDDMDVPPPASR
jgi:competence protein ComEA